MWVTRQIGYLNTVADCRYSLDETIFACDRHRGTDARLNEWGLAGHGGAARGHRSGVPLLLQHFQLSPGTLVTIYERDLPTLRLLCSALGANLSHRPQTTSEQPLLPLWPPDPQHILHSDKTNPNVAHMQNYICIMYALVVNVSTGLIKSACAHIEGVSGYSLARAQRWVIKKSNTVNARGQQHINI